MSNTNNYLKEWEDLFIQFRPYLISFAFRMSGSLSESEDIVQDTFLQCASVNPKEITSPKSWLTKVCSHKALDSMKVAHKKREVYYGVWLPDAVPDSFQYWGQWEEGASPDKKLLLTESLTTSFLLILQKLTPEERVIYLLSDIFDYSFKEIADFLTKTEDACKKSAQRARKAFESEKRFHAFSKNDEHVITHFFHVAKSGDREALLELLAPEAEFWADGGGKASVASRKVITDSVFMTKFISAVWSSLFARMDNIRQEFKVVNERPGWVVSSRSNETGEWVFDTVMSFEIENGKIARIYTQRNPDKLRFLLKK